MLVWKRKAGCMHVLILPIFYHSAFSSEIFCLCWWNTSDLQIYF